MMNGQNPPMREGKGLHPNDEGQKSSSIFYTRIIHRTNRRSNLDENWQTPSFISEFEGVFL
ncbi:hypothetical protein, partial [Scopulibacillus darangshiensis]|uniref:hypothetical protein n=1 Tax=Scopulibacillus darangshiensis TaxID=442528 RepID=UPI001A9E9950